ncbi:MAG: rhodanese-like domain-containing protein [Candidatus Limnocylindrales bacterium]
MEPVGAVEGIDVAEAARRLADAEPGHEPLLVDVREADEFAQLRAEGAILLPLSSFVRDWQRLPADRPILFICASGNRSWSAADYLMRNGRPAVANVEGGTIAWARAGLPVRRGRPEPGEGELPGQPSAGH